MPRISEFYGIAVYMYFREHSPPHFHAFYAGSNAEFSIADGEVLAGRLPLRAAKLVRTWARIRRNELMADWELARAGKDIRPVAPLD